MRAAKTESNLALLRKAAATGYSFAVLLLWKVEMADRDPNESVRILLKLAKQKERDAYYYLAISSQQVRTAEFDDATRVFYTRAAILGHRKSMKTCWEKNYCDRITLAKYFCTYKMADNLDDEFFQELRQQLMEYKLRFIDGRVVYVFAQALRSSKMKMCGSQQDIADRYDLLQEVRELGAEFERKAKDAINTWTLCAKRLGLYKDVHRMISQIVWNGRAAVMNK